MTFVTGADRPLPGPAGRETAAALPLSIPGPRPAFLLGWRGNVLRIARDPLGYLSRLHETYGDVAALVRGGNPNAFSALVRCPGTVAVFGPHYNREVLSNPDLFPMSLRTGLEQTPLAHLGAGLFNTNGERHQQVRRASAPAYHRRWAESHHRSLVALTRQRLDSWRPGFRVDLLQEMQRLTFRSVCTSLFGLAGLDGADALGDLLRDWLEAAHSPAVRLFPVNLPFTPFRRFLNLSRRVDRALATLMEQTRGRTEEADLLAALHRAGHEDGNPLTQEECVGQALSLLVAAHHTTAVALTWTLFLLTQHPAVTADVVEELEGRCHGEAPTPEQLDRLPLLENIVKESLRLLPPVPFAGRVTAEPVALGPYALPRGTEVIYSQYVTHRLPNLYPQPARFLPDRWSRLSLTPFEYLPFGAGPRRCPGAQLAVRQMKTVLALVLQRYRLQPAPAARLDYRIRLTLMPRRGMPMVVWKQDRRFAESKTTVRGSVRHLVSWC
jgi:cytochrome P450